MSCPDTLSHALDQWLGCLYYEESWSVLCVCQLERGGVRGIDKDSYATPFV